MTSEELLKVLTRYEGAIQEHMDSPDEETEKELEEARAALLVVLQEAKSACETLGRACCEWALVGYHSDGTACYDDFCTERAPATGAISRAEGPETNLTELARGPLRRMREAVECVRHEGNDLGECWMDCRRCRLEKELAALAATNAQPATSRAEGPASDALNALVAEKRQLIMDVINTARNGKWNNLVDNAADYALNGFESAVRESAVRDAAFTSQPSAEHAPEVVALSQMKDEEIDTSDIPEVTNWSKAEKGKFYRAATPAQLRSALERLVSKWEKQAHEYRQRQMFDFAQEAGSYADELKAILNTHIAADYKLNSPHMGTEFHVSGEPLTDSETQWLNRSAALLPPRRGNER